MVKFDKYLIIAMVLSAGLAACQEDERLILEDQVSFSIEHSLWVDGRGQTRATQDPITNPQLPEQLYVKSNKGKELWITKGGTGDNSGYTAYHGYSKLYKESQFAADETMTAYAPDEFITVPSCGFVDYLKSDPVSLDKGTHHFFFTLKHQSALIRLFFKVGEDYDKIREVKITSLSFGYDGNTPFPDITDVSSVTVPSSFATQPAAWFYVAPRVLNKTNQLKMKVSYDIYAKQEGTGTRTLVRQVTDAVVNMPVLTSITTGQKLDIIRAEYYYDFKIVIDPDFLYTLTNEDEPADLVIRN